MSHIQAKNQTLLEHLNELRKRLAITTVAFVTASIVAYQFHDRIIEILQSPLHDTLYFSSPGGGFNFVLKVCILTGLLLSSPIVILQIIRFVEPVLPVHKRFALARYIISSLLLLMTGVAFAYFVTLPAALHFLSHFGGDYVKALISVNEYMNFVIAYLVGFGLIFQLPLFMLFINRIRPIPPSSMIKAARYVVVIAFVVAAILTPTPDPGNQLLMAMPIIGMYALSIVVVWTAGRRVRRHAAGVERDLVRISTEEMPSDVWFDNLMQDLPDEPPARRAPTFVSSSPVVRRAPLMDIQAPRLSSASASSITRISPTPSSPPPRPMGQALIMDIRRS